MKSRACNHFDLELQRLVLRFREEYELTYAEAIGSLTLMAHRMAAEAVALETEDDEE